jgi:hypothetical protein
VAGGGPSVPGCWPTDTRHLTWKVTDLVLPTHIVGIPHTLSFGKPIWGIPQTCVTLWEGMWCRERPGEARNRCYWHCTCWVCYNRLPLSVALLLCNPMFCFGCCTQTKPTSILDFLQRLQGDASAPFRLALETGFRSCTPFSLPLF